MAFCPFNPSHVTEYVTVPSSDHVAEIIGRMGCKIKSLRNKTNTFIQTPLRQSDPVFIISGRPDDVSKAKWEILSAADHFTTLRANGDHLAQRRRVLASPGIENIVTISFVVPLHFVGLVVGNHGSNIRQIQLASNTSIRSPLLTGEPVFKVTGSPLNVNRAKELIECCIKRHTVDTELFLPCQGGRLSRQFLQHRCLICGISNIKSHTILLPCGHFVCIYCSRALELEPERQCPICSQVIGQMVHAEI